MHFYGHFFSFEVVDAEKNDFNAYAAENHSETEELATTLKDGRLGAIPKFMNKGMALAEAIKILDVSPEDVMIAGDETADIAMMQPSLARMAVCPENAADAVKKHVLAMNGAVGVGHSSHGIIDAFKKLFP